MRAVCMLASDLLRACTSYLCAIAPQRLQHRGSKTDETRLDFGPVEHTPASNMYDVVSATSAFKTVCLFYVSYVKRCVCFCSFMRAPF